jgi:hypothetical protein
MFDRSYVTRIKFLRSMSSASSGGVRALCVTSNLSLRKTLRRTLNAGGSNVEFADSLPEQEVELAAEAAMLFIDNACRRNATAGQLTQIIGEGGRVIILGDSLEDDEVVELLRNRTVNHVISDSESPDEVELVVTSVKLQSGDIFGLEKYLAWGAKVHEVDINTYEEKRVALLTIAKHAKSVGARRHVIGKIESVTDELLMNALYDAPAVSQGVPPAQRVGDPAEIANQRSAQAARLRYACDGRYFAVSVQDNYGELHKEAILDHLIRARAERGAPKLGDEGGAGAGLGLYFILSSVTRFIANIDKGSKTEVVCLFDLKESGRQASSCARSLHIFTT